MKTTTAFRFIIAAMAAIPVFASCQKERADETPDTPAQTDEVRVITLQFANSTKTTLDSDGVTPKFENGDQILLSNGTDAPETATVSVAGGIATCTTKLKGALKAVYPATAAKLNGNVIEGVLVPTEQDGTFKSANICMAENIDASANFVNKTALFEITPPSLVNTFTIRSLNTIDATTGRRSATDNAVAINTTGADNAAKREISVSVVGGKAYVSLVPGVNLTDLSFEYTATGATDGAMKGIPANEITGEIVDATAPNVKYTIDNQNWHPYVTIGGKKWATMNIGASSETDYGYHFFWGGTKGYKHNGSNWVEADATSGSVLTNGFVIGNDPHYDNTNSKYTKYTGTSGDGKTVLELADDAAYANWGGPWRMPTGGARGEFQALQNAAPGVWTEGSVNGIKVTETSTSKTLFFPATGASVGTAPFLAGSSAFYWSSSLDTRSDYEFILIDSDHAFSFTDSTISSGDPQDDSGLRYVGHCVRPVSD